MSSSHLTAFAASIAGALLLALTPAATRATPISYVWSGAGTFSIGGSSYTGDFVLTADGDTSAVSPAGGDFFFASNSVTATLSVGSGALSVTLAEPVWVGVLPSLNLIGFLADASSGGANSQFLGVNGAFSSYALGAALAPVALTSYNGLFFAGPTGQFTTSAGLWTGATDIGPYTFTATLAPVPLPAALPLFASGLALAGYIGSRRRRATLGA
jgi:hypothetical protein